MKLYFIEARTGCSCCLSENHYCGPYRTAKDALRRINAMRLSSIFPHPHQKEWKYWVEEREVTNTLRSGSFVVLVMDGIWVYDTDVVEVAEDGSVKFCPMSERFGTEYDML